MAEENKKILIIDDDPGIRKVIKLQVKTLKRDLLEASNRAEALILLKQENVAAIICDIKLKEEYGFDLVREFRILYPELPIIMLTGFIEQEFYDAASAMGCLDMLIKPVRKEKLVEALEKAFQCSRR